eukprot:2191314-Prymnesium_polylepis.1
MAYSCTALAEGTRKGGISLALPVSPTGLLSLRRCLRAADRFAEQLKPMSQSEGGGISRVVELVLTYLQFNTHQEGMHKVMREPHPEPHKGGPRPRPLPRPRPRPRPLPAASICITAAIEDGAAGGAGMFSA